MYSKAAQDAVAAKNGVLASQVLWFYLREAVRAPGSGQNALFERLIETTKHLVTIAPEYNGLIDRVRESLNTPRVETVEAENSSSKFYLSDDLTGFIENFERTTRVD